jgi:hypothetical protein
MGVQSPSILPTQPITRNRMGPPMIRCRGHGYRLVIAALV